MRKASIVIITVAAGLFLTWLVLAYIFVEWLITKVGR